MCNDAPSSPPSLPLQFNAKPRAKDDRIVEKAKRLSLLNKTFSIILLIIIINEIASSSHWQCEYIKFKRHFGWQRVVLV